MSVDTAEEYCVTPEATAMISNSSLPADRRRTIRMRPFHSRALAAAATVVGGFALGCAIGSEYSTALAVIGAVAGTVLAAVLSILLAKT